MKKFYNRIPDFVLEKINSYSSHFDVAVVKKIYFQEIRNGDYKHVGLSLEDDKLKCKAVIPEYSRGRFSKRNLLGYTSSPLKHLPKVSKTIDLGQRPIFGDWSNGSFNLSYDREVYQRETFSARNFSIIPSAISSDSDEGGDYTIVLFRVNKDFHATAYVHYDLMLALNLLQESLGVTNVFSKQSSMMDYVYSISVDWQIFPPEHTGRLFSKLVGKRKLSDHDEKWLRERLDFIKTLNPTRFIHGLGSSNSYFGAVLDDNLVIFENIYFGNALYILFEDWQEVSKLSRTKILNSAKNYVRIIHIGNWRDKVLRILKKAS